MNQKEKVIKYFEGEEFAAKIADMKAKGYSDDQIECEKRFAIALADTVDEGLITNGDALGTYLSWGMGKAMTYVDRKHRAKEQLGPDSEIPEELRKLPMMSQGNA